MHFITSHFTLLPVLPRPGGLVIEMIDGNASTTRALPNSTSVTRLSWALSQEVAPHGATAVSLAPGWMRPEIMLDVSAATRRHALVDQPHLDG